MAGRRIRDTVVNALEPKFKGLMPVIAGLSNAYCGYLTTREEYATQSYEGSSTHFGPNQLVGTQQELEKLAKSITTDSKIYGYPHVVPPKIAPLSFGTGVLFDGR